MSKEKVIYQGPTKEEQNAKRHMSGVFRDNVLEMYAKNPFKGTAERTFQRGLNDGSYELNFKDFEQLLRFWGTKNILDLKADDGCGLLEAIVRYGSFNDFLIFKNFTPSDFVFDVDAIHVWANDSGNSIFLSLV